MFIPGSYAFRLKLSVQKQKKRMMMIGLLILAVLGWFFTANDAFLYKTTIVRITENETALTGTENAMISGVEHLYAQKMTGIILNGEKKGTYVDLYNQFSDSKVREERYSIGDELLVELGKDGSFGKILMQKRDTFVYLIAAALILGMIAAADFAGLLAVASLVINMILLVVALHLYLAGWNVFYLTAVIIFLFSVLSLLIGNGFHQRSFLAVIVTLLSIAATAAVYLMVRMLTPDLQYQLLEYAVVPDDLHALFFCEVMIGGLGAVMDIAISLISTADELMEKDPYIPYQTLKASVREVSDDIMGTMINVLFFTYICGGLPEMLLMLRNNLSISFVWEYVLSFEMVRFLTGSIGLVLAVPVSQLVLYVWYHRKETAHG